MHVLGIETSCDETAAAVVTPGGVLSDVVHTQRIHMEYGGVVPELAGRAHVEQVVVTATAALAEAGITRPDAVAATAGPGLQGAVLVGLCFGKALACGWGVPFVGVNHLEGHLLSAMLEPDGPDFPFLALVVSGGHTTIYLARALGHYEVLGTTVDDAAGEAYDKVARLLGLGYPGGPAIDRLAAQGDAEAIAFPRPRPKQPLNMSFSGLKTAVRQYVDANADAPTADVAASFQAAVVDVLISRVILAAEQTGVRDLAVAGGVAANSGLRARLERCGLNVTLPPPARCTDNGSMIGFAGLQHLSAGHRDGLGLPCRAQWTPGT